MKTVTVAALLLVLAIAQSQAFYTLFEQDFRRFNKPHPHDGEVILTEAELAERQEAAEAAQGEVAEPVGVTQQDITLLRRDLLISMERLRRTIEASANRARLNHDQLTYPY